MDWLYCINLFVLRQRFINLDVSLNKIEIEFSNTYTSKTNTNSFIMDIILSKLQSGEISQSEAQEQIEKINRSKEGVIEQRRKQYSVSEKGCISIYGIRKMPISLYINEIEKLKQIFESQDFITFVAQNEERLSRK